MANITYTITQDGDEISYTINDGVGPAGPNNITTATSTDITGILKGDGANVSAAVDGTDYLTPSSVDARIADAINFFEDYFFTATPDALGGIYYEMKDTNGGVSADLVSGTLAAGNDQALLNFINNAGLGVSQLEGGYYELHVHASKTGTKATTIYAEIYTRTTGGTETLIGTTEVSGQLTGSDAVYDLTTRISDTPINTTDKLVVKWYANVGSAGSDVAVTIKVDGNTNSRIHVPVTTEILAQKYQAILAEGSFVDGDKTKLDGIEAGATADQTAAEILTALKTVDGTGSGLDADLLDGQDSSAFATSAQGALADSAVQPGDNLDVMGGVTITAPTTAGQYLRYDGVSEFRNSAIGASDLPDLSSTYATAAQGTLADSAVQPGDIDTLAELNAIITDATLIDTTDSRLSDARTPTAHTHTASDLDFAGSTDIGADLADADEVLVSDGGGNTTRVKSALSRFWTYIKAKIESVGLSSLNISGNLTVDTDTLQVNATTNEVTIAQDLYSQSPILVVNGFSGFDGGLGTFSVNAGSWNGSTFTGDQAFAGDLTAANITADGTFKSEGSGTSESYFGSGNFSGGETYQGIWLSAPATPITPSFTNYTILSSVGNTSINARPGEEFRFKVGNTTEATLDTSGIDLASGNILSFAANSGTWDGATISGNQSFSGQVELTGQAASTDDSAMTRSLVDTDRWLASSRIWSPSYAFALANSGTGSQAITIAGELMAQLDSGTSNSGYGKARLARGLNSAPGYSGSGIQFQREIGISLNITLVTTGTEVNVFRIIAGAGSGAPAVAGTDPISDDGFGVEVRSDGTNTEWRVFGHNGTTLTTSAWTNLYTGNRLHPQMFAVYSDASGNVTAYNTNQGGNTYTTITTTGGPTTGGASATSYASAECVNSASGTTSTRCKIYDVKFYTP